MLYTCHMEKIKEEVLQSNGNQSNDDKQEPSKENTKMICKHCGGETYKIKRWVYPSRLGITEYTDGLVLDEVVWCRDWDLDAELGHGTPYNDAAQKVCKRCKQIKTKKSFQTLLRNNGVKYLRPICTLCALGDKRKLKSKEVVNETSGI